MELRRSLVDLLILQPPDFIRRAPDEIFPTYSEERYLPYGALFVATHLARRGSRARVVPLRELYQRDGPYRHFDDGTPASLRRFTERTRTIVHYLLERFRPRVLGLSVNFAVHHRAAEVLLDVLAALAPGRPILVGGNHATFTAEHWLTREAPCTAVVLGEGEETAQRLLQQSCDPRGLPGVAHLGPDGVVLRGPPAAPLSEEALAAPLDLSLVALPRHVRFTELRHYVMFSRGCSHRCSFCTSPGMWGRGRPRPLSAAEQELRTLVARGVRHIFVADDMLPPTGPRLRAIGSLLAQYPDVVFSAMLRVDGLARANAEELRAANLRHVYLGVESFAPSVLAAMHKGSRVTSPEALAPLLAGLRAVGIATTLFLIIGHPGSSLALDLETLASCRWLAERGLVADLHAAHVAPFPGTPVAELAAGPGIRRVEPDYAAWSLSRPMIEHLEDDGRTAYSAGEMDRVFQAYRALRRELHLGETPREERAARGDS